MKYLSVIALLAGMLGQTFSKCFIALDYQWNKDYIAKFLCVNRDRPEMKCDGKCYLCKRLKKEANKDQENPERKLDNSSEIISSWAAYRLTPPASFAIRSTYPAFGERIYDQFSGSFFHPPQAS